MKTELIIFNRPFNNILAAPNEIAYDLATSSNYVYNLAQNTNVYYKNSLLGITRPASNSTGGISIDLYSDVSMPINYTILDVREPDKRKTNWSKTITIPGTKNNNRVFDHIYELGADGWITIGNTSVYESFNPNLRLECIILNDGLQVLKGNLQLKKIMRDLFGNIEYEIAISGDLTSLFFDIGAAKLWDLDFSEWDHLWTQQNVEKSWSGISIRNGQDFTSITSGSPKTISKLYRSSSNGRLSFQTSTSHGLQQDDWVKIELDTAQNSNWIMASGEWQVTNVINSTNFSVNYFYPLGLLTSGYTGTLGTASERTATGRGYVYPMISWGDEYDENSFPVTSFVPGMYLKEVWDKIFKETKSSYQSSFLNSQFFKRLILIQKKASYDINPAEYKERKFCVGSTYSYLTGASYRGPGAWYYPQTSTQSTLTASIFPTVQPTKFPFVSESGSFGTVSFYDNGLTSSATTYGNWDNVTYKWLVSDTGEYDLTGIIKLTAWSDMNGAGTPSSSINSGTSSFDTSIYKYYPGSGSEFWTSSYSSGPGPYASINAYTFGMQVKATIKRLRDGVVSEIGSSTFDFIMNNQSYWTPTNENWPYFGRYQPPSWKNRDLTVTSGSKYFKKNDEVWIEVSHFIQAYAGPPGFEPATGRKATFCFNQSGGPEIAKAIVGEWFLKIENQSFVFNSPSPRTVEGANLPMTSVLPKEMEAKDFLTGVIKMFNLHIVEDNQIDRHYYIEPRDDFYYDGSTSSHYVDWTDKIDNQTVEITPLGELIAKYYVFENKEESDYWNKKFKEDRGRAYQYYKKEINNDFLKNEAKVSLPFGSTVMINNPAGSDVVMPAILQRESNGSFKPVSNSQPRVLIWGGMRPYSAQRGGARINLSNANFPNAFGWEMLSGSNSTVAAASASIYQQYPYAGTVDSPQDPIADLNWFNMEQGDFVYYDYARWSNENLYNKYWSNFVNEVSDPASKVITAFFDLEASDIFNLDFRKIYVIDGHLLRLQKVMDYDPVVRGLTKCELLKIKSPLKFTRQSVIIDDFGVTNNVFTEITNTTRPVPYIDVQLAPSRKRPEFGFNNSNAGVNLSNSITVQINGLSNFIAPSAKNISITGNENYIGDGTKNVQISGGSGNFVLGGVQNVNIIGTDKKYVSESNITYINGIRYVNGMAVSKANVIDGAIDVSVVRQSQSTTPTVIDAAEDVVIQAGSQVFENVINSGLDSILPDLPELGVSTLVNPNPRTNLTTGYETDYGTQSFIEVIRQRSASR